MLRFMRRSDQKKSEDKLIVVHFVDSEAPLFFDLPVAIVHTPEEVNAIKERVYLEAKQMTLQYKSILEAHKVSNVELILMPCVRPQSRAVKFVGDVGAQVVYVGTHNLGPIARTILGSFSHYVLHNTQGCVVVARESKAPPVRARFEAERPRPEEKLQGIIIKPKDDSDDEVEQALQALVGQDPPGALTPCDQRRTSRSEPPKGLAGNNGEGDDNIDGFILVGPPSLS